MEDYTKYLKAGFARKLSQSDIEIIELYFKEEQGILTISCSVSEIHISFNSYLQSEINILDSISLLGFETIQSSEKKSVLSRWLSKLAKSNKETFGNQRLDCCDMNKN